MSENSNPSTVERARSPFAGPAVAALLIVAVVAWLATGRGVVARSDAPPKIEAAERNTPTATRVRAATSTARTYRPLVVVRGVTQPTRTVQVRAELKGRVIAVPGRKGARVAADETLVRLDIAERQSMLREANAQLAQARLEHKAIMSLRQRGYRADANVAAAKANLERALAARDRIQRQIGYTRIKAPYAGVLERRPVEQGDYVGEGQVIAVVADLDPIVVRGSVSERERRLVRERAPATVRLTDGSVHQGSVRYLASMADRASRTFTVEIAVPNPEQSLVAGLTAEVALEGPETTAHLLPTSLLILDKAGQLGVKLVVDDAAVFTPVQRLDQRDGGLWVTGLPATCQVIVTGAGFVTDGEKVSVDDAGPLRLVRNL